MTLEGALGPNSRLDDAEASLSIAGARSASAPTAAVHLRSAAPVLLLDANGASTPQRWAVSTRPVTAFASSQSGHARGRLAGGDLLLCDGSGRDASQRLDGPPTPADRRLLFLSEDEFAVVDHGYGPDEPVALVRALGRCRRAGK